MGNNCVNSKVLKDGLFQSISDSIWWPRSSDCMVFHTNKQITNVRASSLSKVNESEPGQLVQNNPPEPLRMVDEDHKPKQTIKLREESQLEKPKKPEEEIKPAQQKSYNEEIVKPQEPIRQKEEAKQASKPKKPHNVKRLASAGLQAESVLQTKTGHLKEYYNLGHKLGNGQFGTTFICVEKTTGKEYACKSIAKRKLLTKDDVDDVRREIQIMHHLAGNSNVVSIKGAYEDAVAVHVVMELCSGGELFDRIVKRGHYTERKAAQLTRTILGVVEACHSLGVMHRDLKPENFLFVNEQEDSPLKAIDFGLSVFFKPGTPMFPFLLIKILLSFSVFNSPHYVFQNN